MVMIVVKKIDGEIIGMMMFYICWSFWVLLMFVVFSMFLGSCLRVVEKISMLQLSFCQMFIMMIMIIVQDGLVRKLGSLMLNQFMDRLLKSFCGCSIIFQISMLVIIGVMIGMKNSICSVLWLWICELRLRVSMSERVMFSGMYSRVYIVELCSVGQKLGLLVNSLMQLFMLLKVCLLKVGQLKMFIMMDSLMGMIVNRVSLIRVGFVNFSV